MECFWCAKDEKINVSVLEKFCSAEITVELQHEMTNDLWDCYDCVLAYHAAKTNFLEYHESALNELNAWEIDRLSDHIKNVLNPRVKSYDGESEIESCFQDDATQMCFGFGDGCELKRKLSVPLQEILQYPYLLWNKRLESLAMKALLSLEEAGSPLILNSKLPGIYLLLVHPNSQVRKWARKSVNYLGDISCDDYDDLSDVVKWVLGVPEFGLFQCPEVCENSFDQTTYTILPSHLFVRNSVKEFWLGVCMFLKALKASTVRLQLVSRDNHQAFVGVVVNALDLSNAVDKKGAHGNESEFWPVLHCFIILLERLGTRVWQHVTFPDAQIKVFQLITKHPAYQYELQRWPGFSYEDSQTSSTSCDEDNTGITASQMVYAWDGRGRRSSESSVSKGNRRKVVFAWFKPYITSVVDFGDVGTVVVKAVLKYLHDLKLEYQPRSEGYDNTIAALVVCLDQLFKSSLRSMLTIVSELWIVDIFDVLSLKVKKPTRAQKLANAFCKSLLERMMKRGANVATLLQWFSDEENITNQDSEMLCRLKNLFQRYFKGEKSSPDDRMFDRERRMIVQPKPSRSDSDTSSMNDSFSDGLGSPPPAQRECTFVMTAKTPPFDTSKTKAREKSPLLSLAKTKSEKTTTSPTSISLSPSLAKEKSGKTSSPPTLMSPKPGKTSLSPNIMKPTSEKTTSPTLIEPKFGKAFSSPRFVEEKPEKTPSTPTWMKPKSEKISTPTLLKPKPGRARSSPNWMKTKSVKTPSTPTMIKPKSEKTTPKSQEKTIKDYFQKPALLEPIIHIEKLKVTKNDEDAIVVSDNDEKTKKKIKTEHEVFSTSSHPAENEIDSKKFYGKTISSSGRKNDPMKLLDDHSEDDFLVNVCSQLETKYPSKISKKKTNKQKDSPKWLCAKSSQRVLDDHSEDDFLESVCSQIEKKHARERKKSSKRRTPSCVRRKTTEEVEEREPKYGDTIVMNNENYIVISDDSCSEMDDGNEAGFKDSPVVKREYSAYVKLEDADEIQREDTVDVIQEDGVNDTLEDIADVKVEENVDDKLDENVDLKISEFEDSWIVIDNIRDSDDEEDKLSVEKIKIEQSGSVANDESEIKPKVELFDDKEDNMPLQNFKMEQYSGVTTNDHDAKPNVKASNEEDAFLLANTKVEPVSEITSDDYTKPTLTKFDEKDNLFFENISNEYEIKPDITDQKDDNDLTRKTPSPEFPFNNNNDWDIMFNEGNDDDFVMSCLDIRESMDTMTCVEADLTALGGESDDDDVISLLSDAEDKSWEEHQDRKTLSDSREQSIKSEPVAIKSEVTTNNYDYLTNASEYLTKGFDDLATKSDTIVTKYEDTSTAPGDRTTQDDDKKVDIKAIKSDDAEKRADESCTSPEVSKKCFGSLISKLKSKLDRSNRSNVAIKCPESLKKKKIDEQPQPSVEDNKASTDEPVDSVAVTTKSSGDEVGTVEEEKKDESHSTETATKNTISQAPDKANEPTKVGIVRPWSHTKPPSFQRSQSVLPKYPQVAARDQRSRSFTGGDIPRPVAPKLLEERRPCIVQRRRREVVTKPKRVTTLEEFYFIILKWDANLLYQKPIKPPTIRDNGKVCRLFEGMDHYYNLFKPLVFLEVWAQVVREWKECVAKSSHRIYSLIVDSVNRFVANFQLIKCKRRIKINENEPELSLRESDLVLIPVKVEESSAETTQCFAMVDSVSREFSQSQPGEDGGQYLEFTIILRMLASTRSPIVRETLNCTFVASLVTFIRQWKGLMFLPNSLLARDILSPRIVSCKTDQVVIEQDQMKESGLFNDSQQRAIESTCEAIRKPYPIPKICFIQGPPGTGKSHTIIGLIKKHLKNRSSQLESERENQLPGSSSNTCYNQSSGRILLCAPSNAAIDVLVRRLVADMKANKDEFGSSDGKNCGSVNIVRVGRFTSVHRQVQPYTLDILSKTELAKFAANDVKAGEEVKEKLDRLRQSIDKLEEECYVLRCSGHDINSEEVKSVNLKIDELTKKKKLIEKQYGQIRARTRTRKRQEEKIKKDILFSADVICSTLNGSGSYLLSNELLNSNRKHLPFGCVIVDEACQSCELDVLIPLQFGSSKLILVGDPEQLPTTVLSQKAQELLFGQSLYERHYRVFRERAHGAGRALHATKDNPIQMLDVQYRMHPDIASFPSSHVYQGRLKNARCVLTRSSISALKPYIMLNVRSGRERPAPGGSICNPLESDFVLEICLLLRKTLQERHIGIITPYRAQVNLVGRRLRERGIDKIEVNTVDGFQGREKEVIIMSCVRANGLAKGIGFLADRQRMNVALTRGRYSLVILLHCDSLVTNRDWKACIDDAKKRGFLHDVNTSTDLNIAFHNEPLKTLGKPSVKGEAGSAIDGQDKTPECNPPEIVTSPTTLLDPRKISAKVYPKSSSVKKGMETSQDMNNHTSSNNRPRPKLPGNTDTFDVLVKGTPGTCNSANSNGGGRMIPGDTNPGTNTLGGKYPDASREKRTKVKLVCGKVPAVGERGSGLKVLPELFGPSSKKRLHESETKTVLLGSNRILGDPRVKKQKTEKNQSSVAHSGQSQLERGTDKMKEPVDNKRKLEQEEMGRKRQKTNEVTAHVSNPLIKPNSERKVRFTLPSETVDHVPKRYEPVLSQTSDDFDFDEFDPEETIPAPPVEKSAHNPPTSFGSSRHGNAPESLVDDKVVDRVLFSGGSMLAQNDPYFRQLLLHERREEQVSTTWETSPDRTADTSRRPPDNHGRSFNDELSIPLPGGTSSTTREEHARNTRPSTSNGTKDSSRRSAGNPTSPSTGESFVALAQRNATSRVPSRSNSHNLDKVIERVTAHNPRREPTQVLNMNDSLANFTRYHGGRRARVAHATSRDHTNTGHVRHTVASDIGGSTHGGKERRRPTHMDKIRNALKKK